jgi:hypothetical protein
MMASTGTLWRGVAVVVLGMLGATQARAEVGHVIHISVDGLRGDFLKSRIENDPELYSNFKRFVDEGATTFNARTEYTHTTTLPNHTSMVTGRPVSRPTDAPTTIHHGYTSNSTPGVSDTLHNDGNPNLSYVASTFDVAHDNGLKTALYAGKTKFSIYDQSYNATTGALDVTGEDNGRDKIDFYTSHPLAHDMFLAALGEEHFEYSFLHYLHPDGAGHSEGWGSESWNAIVQFVDDHLGSVMDYVQSDPELANDTVLILTADHGGSGTGHSSASSATNYTIPLLVWGAGVAPGVDLYTLNPTTRTDPGTSRPDYNAAEQPIRNGDSGNLALGLLGLGAVPGSSINANQDLAVASLFSADFNGDLTANELDLAIWQNHYGSTSSAPSVRGDADGDRDVDGRDFLTWQQQVGSPLPPITEVQAVPEPTAAVLALLSLFALGKRQRHSS